jgi:putative ABC transport system permease protein
VLAPLALGIFVSYRVFQTLDLTADGAFGVGAALAAALLQRGAPPLAATVVAAGGGLVAGTVTGLLSTRLSVSTLLAGVLTSTALYSAILFIMGGGNLSLASMDTLGGVVERFAHRFLQLPNAVTLFGTSVSPGVVAMLGVTAVIAAGLVIGLALLLATDVGLAMRSAGTNPQMARAVGVEVDRMVVLGLGLANGLIALGGALFAQYQGFANIEMGIGALIMGVASLLLGEAIVGRRPLGRWIAAAAVGALVLRLLVAGAIRAGLPPNALKLVTALFVLAVLIAPRLVHRPGRPVQGARSHA